MTNAKAKETTAMPAPINLETIKNSKVTVPLVWLFIILIAGWQGPDALTQYLSTEFLTAAYGAEVRGDIEEVRTAQKAYGSVLNEHITEFRLSAAVQAIGAFQDALARHRATPRTSPGWQAEERNLVGKVDLANQYKNCVLNNGTNCEQLRKLLWR